MFKTGETACERKDTIETNCTVTHTHACTHTYKTHPQITLWLNTEEAGQTTQSDHCHGNRQMGKRGGGLMRGSLVRRAAWDCHSPASWHEFRKRRKPGQAKPRDQIREEGARQKGGNRESTWSVIRGRNRRRTVRSCKNTVWNSDGGAPRLCFHRHTYTYSPVCSKNISSPSETVMCFGKHTSRIHALTWRRRPVLFQIGTVSRQTRHNTPVN